MGLIGAWIAAIGAMAIAPDTLVMEVHGRVGELTGAGFERIEAVETDSAGRIYALDSYAHRLSAFEADGRAAWSVGREGRGPGEFDSPVGLAWAPDGSLWVIDPGNQRATPVSLDGRVLDASRLPSGFELAPWPGRFDRAGRLYHYRQADGYSYDLAQYDEDLRRLRVLPTPEPPEPGVFFEGRTERGSHMRARVPHTARLVWRLDSEGAFVTNWTSEARFPTSANPSGRTTIPESAPPRLTVAERRGAVEGLSSFVRRGGVADARRIPERKQLFSTFVLDGEDRIWALRSRAAGAEGSLFEVVDPEGGHLASVRIAARISTRPFPVIRDGWFVGVEVDDFGLQTIVLARVPEGVR